MYKLMIVEDEELVREGMLKIIDFKAYGYEVVAVCENGRVAYEKFNEVLPDIVLTDICMDEMTGFEFLEKIYYEGIPTKFLIISGYDDYAYMKQAIKFKVMDYILKPISARELIDILIRVKKEIEKEKEKFIENLHLENSQAEADYISKELLLNKIISLKLGKEVIKKQAEKLGIKTTYEKYLVTIFDVKNRYEVVERLKLESNDSLTFIMFNVINEIAGNSGGEIVFTDNYNRVIMLNFGNAMETTKKAETIIYASSNWLRENMELDIIARIGDEVELKDLNSSFISSNELFNLITEEKILKSSEVYKQIKEYNFDINKEIEKVINVIDSENLKLKDYTNELRQTCSKLYMKKNGFIVVLINIIKGVEEKYKETEEKIDPSIIPKISEASDVDKILTIFENGLEEYIFRLKSGKNSVKDILIRKALKFIDEKYSDYNLSNVDVANEINVSVSYFLAIFKNSVGVTFTKYLNNLRLDKAKDYLKYSNKNVNEIGEMVGYINNNYFIAIFKKVVGIPPNSYRKKYR